MVKQKEFVRILSNDASFLVNYKNCWMQKDGSWGDWSTAKRMTQEKAEEFAKSHGVQNFGLFP